MPTRDQICNQRDRRILMLAAGAAIVLWLSILGLGMSEFRSIEMAAEDDIHGATDVVAAHADRSFDATALTLKSVAAWLDDATHPQTLLTLNDLLDFTDEVRASEDDILAVYPVLGDGSVLERGNHDQIRTIANINREPFFKALSETTPKSLRLGILETKLQTLPALYAGIKVNPNRFGIAYLIAAIDITRFDRAYKHLLPEWHHRLGLMTEAGAVLYQVPRPSSAQSEIAGALDSNPATRDPAIAAIIGGAVDPMEQQPAQRIANEVLGSVRVENGEVVVFSAIDRRDIAATWLRHMATPIAFVAVMTIFGFWATARILRLIHERDHQMAAAREAQKRAITANMAKTQFLSRVGHELRTPLNAIMGFSEVITGAFFGPIPAHYRNYGRDVGEAGSRLLKTINQILDIAAIEKGELDHEGEVCDTAATVLKVVDQLQPEAEAKGSSIRLVTVSTVTAGIGPTLLERAVSEAAGNAIRHGKPGGEVDIRISTTEEEAIIEVTDDGPGIAPERLPRLFNPLESAGGWIADEGSRTGMGLKIAADLMQLHGGAIAIASEPGKGTRVTIRVPVAA